VVLGGPEKKRKKKKAEKVTRRAAKRKKEGSDMFVDVLKRGNANPREKEKIAQNTALSYLLSGERGGRDSEGTGPFPRGKKGEYVPRSCLLLTQEKGSGNLPARQRGKGRGKK